MGGLGRHQSQSHWSRAKPFFTPVYTLSNPNVYNAPFNGRRPSSIIQNSFSKHTFSQNPTLSSPSRTKADSINMLWLFSNTGISPLSQRVLFNVWKYSSRVMCALQANMVIMWIRVSRSSTRHVKQTLTTAKMQCSSVYQMLKSVDVFLTEGTWRMYDGSNRLASVTSVSLGLQ